MHRLAVFRHNIVCNIDQVVDWADALRGQAALHPLRGRGNFDIFDRPRHIAGTQIRILYRHLDIIVHILAVARFRYLRQLQFPAKRRRRFPCDTDYRKAVRPVGGHLVFKYGVMQPQKPDGVRSHRDVLFKNINPQFRRFRIHLAA